MISDFEGASSSTQPEAGHSAFGARAGRVLVDQRFAFVVVGGINTALGIGWFVVFQKLIGASLGYMVSLLLSHVAAVLCAFVLHRRFVFKVRGNVLVDLLRFETVNLVNLAITAALLPIAVEFLHAGPIVAQALITCGTVLLSYFGHRYFSFRR